MAEDIAGALAILERAMDIEKEGREFYLQASYIVQDWRARETLTILTEDEQKHFNLIQRQHESLTRESKWTNSPEVKSVKIDLDKPLFPSGKEALEKATNATSSDLEALLFGLEIETKSYDLYRQAAMETTDQPGKTLFEFLAREERGHFNTLMMRYENLAGRSAGWSA